MSTEVTETSVKAESAPVQDPEQAKKLAERKARKEAAKAAKAEKKANRGKPNGGAASEAASEGASAGEVIATGADGHKFTLKTPKGTCDFNGAQMRVREACIALVKRVFKKHGAVTIDTPVFELRETLMGKYGEDSKLIYDLQDQGGELCSLRYDLTVPFARYVAMNHLSNLRRFQIAKVYRRDQPAITKGRFREFYQCDFDIAGQYDSMVADSECLCILCDALDEFAIGDYIVKLNHRKLLDGIFEICGVPLEKMRPICSAVDKLDKLSWEEVRKEMVEVKGLAPESADKIKKFVLQKGPAKEMLASLVASGRCKGNANAELALEELATLFRYTDAMGITNHISLDLSLARGLDYYTGVVFEAVLQGAVVGSVSGGGRYDELVNMFGGEKIPAVGFSLGLERLFAIAESMLAAQGGKLRENDTEVFVLSGIPDSLEQRMQVCSELWAAGIPTEFVPKASAKLKPQMTAAQRAMCPVVVIFGEDEIAKGTITVKDMSKHEQVEVPRAQLVEQVRKVLAHPSYVPVEGSEDKKVGDHTLKRVTFTRPVRCSWCGEIIAGVSSQGYICETCETACHVTCSRFASSLPCKH